MAEKPVISITDLELNGMSDKFVPLQLRDVRARAESEAITLALMRSNTISEAANNLGVTRPTLYNLIGKYDLETHLVGKRDRDS